MHKSFVEKNIAFKKVVCYMIENFLCRKSNGKRNIQIFQDIKMRVNPPIM